jgi:hypothetical protein
MIEIRSFKEIAKPHQAGVVPFRIVQEVGFVLLNLCGYVGKDIANATSVGQQEIDWLLTLSEDIEFMSYLGGFVFICQTVDDLIQVTGMDFEFANLHGRWPNCMEAVLALDDARYLLNADGTADYALLFAATNNAGGPSWFIPQHLWQAAQINKQIEANHQFWSVAK